jgi:hypothetical protein
VGGVRGGQRRVKVLSYPRNVAVAHAVGRKGQQERRGRLARWAAVGHTRAVQGFSSCTHPLQAAASRPARPLCSISPRCQQTPPPLLPPSLVQVLQGAAHGVDHVVAGQVGRHAVLQGAVPARPDGCIPACARCSQAGVFGCGCVTRSRGADIWERRSARAASKPTARGCLALTAVVSKHGEGALHIHLDPVHAALCRLQEGGRPTSFQTACT